MTPAFLAGRTSPDALSVEIDARRSRDFAAMASYYRNIWRPSTGRTDLPPALTEVSVYRSFQAQAAIVASQLRALGVTAASSDEHIRQALLEILKTRSIPGFSRHHWRTEVDVVSADSRSWQTLPALIKLEEFTRYEAPRFGFYTPYWEGFYPEPNLPHYNSEPWHLSYYPLAAQFKDAWLAYYGGGDGLASLLDSVAASLSSLSGIPAARLRSVLGSLDLASYQRNVAPSQPVPSPL